MMSIAFVINLRDTKTITSLFPSPTSHARIRGPFPFTWHGGGIRTDRFEAGAELWKAKHDALM